MAEDTDDKFFDRADAHIHLSNEQLKDMTRGKVSASMMYATARFSAWLSATWADSPEEMAESRSDNIEYFMKSFRASLEKHYDDYLDNFEDYMRTPESDGA